MQFYFDEEIEKIIGEFVDDLMDISKIPILEFGKNMYWQMVPFFSGDTIYTADNFFKYTFRELYETNTEVTVINFRWKMTNMVEPEHVLVFFLFPPDELKKKLKSALDMKAFW